MGTKLAFVDTETTGLDPARHEIWEVGLILREEGRADTEHRWLLFVDLAKADPMALKISGFHKRHPHGHDPVDYDPSSDPKLTSPSGFARDFARLTHGAHLVGAVVSFDEERLRRLLLAAGEIPGWHYHLVTVEALAAGYLAGNTTCVRAAVDVAPPPWDSEELSREVGVNPADFQRHTALGDARWARAMYDAVMG